MYFLDAFFRFSGVAMLVLIALTTIRDRGRQPGRLFLILACISLSGLFIGYTLDELRPPQPLLWIARIIDVPHLVFVWLFAQSLYQKDFKLTGYHWIIAVVYCAPILWVRLSGLGVLPGYHNWLLVYVSATSFLIAGHLVYIVLRELPDDLQEKRRNSRFYFVFIVILCIGAAALAEPKLAPDAAINLRTFTIISIWPGIALGAFWLLSANPKALLFHDVDAPFDDLSEPDRQLIVELMRVMEEEEVFRDPALSIPSLAQSLATTQHRLRILINRELGYRNFSTYLTEFRLKAAMTALADKEQSHLAIQTIAFDCGFGSMASFNRAFKADQGQTPSEYRNGLA